MQEPEPAAQVGQEGLHPLEVKPFTPGNMSDISALVFATLFATTRLNKLTFHVSDVALFQDVMSLWDCGKLPNGILPILGSFHLVLKGYVALYNNYFGVIFCNLERLLSLIPEGVKVKDFKVDKFPRIVMLCNILAKLYDSGLEEKLDEALTKLAGVIAREGTSFDRLTCLAGLTAFRDFFDKALPIVRTQHMLYSELNKAAKDKDWDKSLKLFDEFVVRTIFESMIQSHLNLLYRGYIVSHLLINA